MWGLHEVEHDELDGELCDPEDALCAWTRTLFVMQGRAKCSNAYEYLLISVSRLYGLEQQRGNKDLR